MSGAGSGSNGAGLGLGLGGIGSPVGSLVGASPAAARAVPPRVAAAAHQTAAVWINSELPVESPPPLPGAPAPPDPPLAEDGSEVVAGTPKVFRGYQVRPMSGAKTEMSGLRQLGQGFLAGVGTLLTLGHSKWTRKHLSDAYNGYTQPNIIRTTETPLPPTTPPVPISMGRRLGQGLVAAVGTVLTVGHIDSVTTGLSDAWEGASNRPKPPKVEDVPEYYTRPQDLERPYSVQKQANGSANAELQDYVREKMVSGDYTGGTTDEGHKYILDVANGSFIFLPQYKGDDPDHEPYDFDKIKVIDVFDRVQGTKVSASVLKQHVMIYSANRENIDRKMGEGSYYLVFETSFDGTLTIGLIPNKGINTSLKEISIEVEVDKGMQEHCKKILKGDIKPNEKVKPMPHLRQNDDDDGLGVGRRGRANSDEDGFAGEHDDPLEAFQYGSGAAASGMASPAATAAGGGGGTAAGPFALGSRTAGSPSARGMGSQRGGGLGGAAGATHGAAAAAAAGGSRGPFTLGTGTAEHSSARGMGSRRGGGAGMRLPPASSRTGARRSTPPRPYTPGPGGAMDLTQAADHQVGD